MQEWKKPKGRNSKRKKPCVLIKGHDPHLDPSQDDLKDGQATAQSLPGDIRLGKFGNVGA